MKHLTGLVAILTSLSAMFAVGSVFAQSNRGTPSQQFNFHSVPDGFSPVNSGNYYGTQPSPWQATVLARNLYATPSGALSSWGVGNGGDWLRIGFARARDHAATIISRLKPDSLRHLKDDALRQWILTNQQALAADILASVHIWGDYENEQSSCAWTWMPVDYELSDLPVNRPIRFAYSLCRDSAESLNFLKATQLLIHEAAHHFDKDDDFADKLAIAIVDAWRSGAIDWMPVAIDQMTPEAREQHSAVWSGKEMIVYGGKKSSADGFNDEALSSAAAYDPSFNSWRDLPELSHLTTPRFLHQAHWAEDRMVVWGGYQFARSDSRQWQYSGFVWHDGEIHNFNAPSDWTSNEDQLSKANFPRQQSVWTGKELLVLGGMGRDGLPLAGSYQPSAGQWTSDLGRTEAHAPKRIEGHSMVWTGAKLIVWGGTLPNGNNSNLGAVYDPNAMPGQRWSPMSTVNVPSIRSGHTAIWTGQHMIMFSGGGPQSNADLIGSGGIYDFASNRWVLSLNSEMVMERLGHTATWNGHEMLIFGGRSNRLRSVFGQVFSFEPESRRWQGAHSQFGPSSRENHSAVWTGSSLIIWGGSVNQVGNRQVFGDGGIFYP